MGSQLLIDNGKTLVHDLYGLRNMEFGLFSHGEVLDGVLSITALQQGTKSSAFVECTFNFTPGGTNKRCFILFISKHIKIQKAAIDI